MGGVSFNIPADSEENMVGLGVSSGTDYSYIDLTPFLNLKMQLKRILVEKKEGYGENGLIRIQMAKANTDICFHIWTVKIWL